MKLKLLSHVRLFVTLWTVAYQAPLSMEFSRQESWSGLPFPSPGDLPNPGIKPGSPTLQADTLPAEPPRKPCKSVKVLKRDWKEAACLLMMVTHRQALGAVEGSRTSLDPLVKIGILVLIYFQKVVSIMISEESLGKLLYSRQTLWVPAPTMSGLIQLMIQTFLLPGRPVRMPFSFNPVTPIINCSLQANLRRRHWNLAQPRCSSSSQNPRQLLMPYWWIWFTDNVWVCNLKKKRN